MARVIAVVISRYDLRYEDWVSTRLYPTVSPKSFKHTICALDSVPKGKRVEHWHDNKF